MAAGLPRHRAVVVRGMVSAFVSPVAGWRPPLPETKSLTPPQSIPAEPDWCDFAAQERWEEAILAYLRADWRKAHRLWTVVNCIVAESRQQSRFDTRAATFEVLQEVMRLRRERVIFRYRRKWIAILDSGPPIIPMKDLPRQCGKRERTRPA